MPVTVTQATGREILYRLASTGPVFIIDPFLDAAEPLRSILGQALPSAAAAAALMSQPIVGSPEDHRLRLTLTQLVADAAGSFVSVSTALDGATFRALLVVTPIGSGPYSDRILRIQVNDPEIAPGLLSAT